MRIIRAILGWVFKLNPLRISLLIMAAFVFLYTQKEGARRLLEQDVYNPPFKFLQLIESKAYDTRFQIVNAIESLRPEISGDIVIAEIDDASVAHWGWPFPRSKWGDFLARMEEYGAAVVAFDVVFADPGEYLGLKFIRDAVEKYESMDLSSPPRVRYSRRLYSYFNRVKDFGDYMEKKQIEADQDRVFAQALDGMDNVVLGWYGYRSRQELLAQPDQDFTEEAEFLMPSNMPVIFTHGWDMNKLVKGFWKVRFMGLQTNIRSLSENASHFGFFTAIPDVVDGTLRRTPLISVFTLDESSPDRENTFIYPALGLSAVSVFLDKDPVIQIGNLGARIALGDRIIPTDQYGRVLINWMGRKGTFPYESVHDIITGYENSPDKDPEKIFKNKIVFIGSTTIGAHDLRNTPFGNAPGVEMHANVVSNILKGNTLIKPDWFFVFDVLFIISVGIVFGLVLPRLSAIWGGVVTVILFLAYLGLNFYFFLGKQYSFSLVFPLSELAFVYIGITIYRYATEEREKRFIKGTFEHYLSPAVIEHLMEDPSKLKLGGEERIMTAFFSDIQGFTTISENLKHAVVPFLNEYLTEMCDIILGYDGTIDKFEGDAIIAFFGAPLDMPDHAVRACLCTVDIQEKMVELRKKWADDGLPPIHMRIGVNSGEMTVGNMGSRHRFDYTMIGDEVNLAARLEGAGKQYKVYSLISQATREAAGDLVEVRYLDSVRVVGKDLPVKIYELLGKKGEVQDKKRRVAEAFSRARVTYQEKDFESAIILFQQALEIDPEDGPSQVFINRCHNYMQSPPPEDWDGVFSITEK